MSKRHRKKTVLPHSCNAITVEKSGRRLGSVHDKWVLKEDPRHKPLIGTKT